ALASAGCDEPVVPQVPVNDMPAQPTARRIVTLAPALTQMVIDLGLRDEIVGVADIDPAAPRGVTTVGNFKQPDIEKIASLRPTHVLTMTDLEGESPMLRDFAAQHGFALASFPSPTEVFDVYDVLVL